MIPPAPATTVPEPATSSPDAPAPRLLLVTQQLRRTRSGVGRYARILVDELCRRGAPPVVATWTDEVDADAFPRCDWVPLGSPPRWDPTAGSFLALGARLRAAVLADAPEVDAVFFADARESASYLRGGGPLAGVPLIGVLHDDYAARAPGNPFAYVGRDGRPLVRWAYYRAIARLERRVYPRFDLLMANAAATADVVARRYGLDRAAIRIVPLCCAPPSPAAIDAPPLAGSPSLLLAGGNFHRKGLDVLIRALPAIVAERPRAHAHVAGHDPTRGRLEKLAARLGVADHLTFHGRVARDVMEAWMGAADQYVMPSRTEALGLVYLEAMQAGTPVVAGNEGGVTEIVRDGASGLTVPVEDPDALARAVLRIAGDPDLAARLVEGGREVVAERTPARLARETLDAVRGVLAGSPGTPARRSHPRS